MPVVNGYCTADDLKDWVGSTSGKFPLFFDQAVNAASRAIDSYCQRHFWEATAQARVLDACDARLLQLGAFGDLVSIDANGLKTDESGDGTYETTWATTDYQLLPLRPVAAPEQKPYRSISAVATRLFPLPTAGTRAARIQITGTWGWPAIPADVTQACLTLAARLYRRKDSPEGVAGFGDFGQIRISRIDPDVQALLDPYRLYPVKVA